MATQGSQGKKPGKSPAPVPGDDFRVEDGNVTDGVSTGTETTAITAGDEGEAPRVPARYEENFDEALAPAWVSAPYLTLVHGVGEYKNNHDVGRFVLGSLERAVELTRTTLNRVKNPEDARKNARFKILVVGISTPVYQPDVKPDHPGFKLEVPTGAKITEGPDAGRFEHDVAIAKMGGTTDRRTAKMKGLQLFLPKSEVTLLIEKPDHVTDEFADFFQYTLDGKQYALARYFAKKTAFTHFVEKARSIRKSYPTRFKDTPTVRGRWYYAPLLMGADIVQPEGSSNSFFVPNIEPCSDEIGPELAAFALQADPIPRG